MKSRLGSCLMGSMVVLTALGVPGHAAYTAIPRSPFERPDASIRRRAPGSPLQAVIAAGSSGQFRPATATNICINFTSSDAPDPHVRGDLWELRSVSCQGSDCLIMTSRPPHPLVDDFHPRPSTGTLSAGLGTVIFNWQGMWNDQTGEGSNALESGWSAYSCRLGGGFPNFGGFAATAGVADAFIGLDPPTRAHSLTLVNPNRLSCHLDLCTSFHD